VIRAVIDTNVLVSGLLSPTGNEALILLAVHQEATVPDDRLRPRQAHPHGNPVSSAAFELAGGRRSPPPPTRTTQLYCRRRDKVSPDEVERIAI
jgi:hypothetical protein